jgi:hypothetical protein
MATSPNYGWSEPDNDGLVRNGALAIRTLGNAIDTSLWNSGYGQAGKNKVINGDFSIWQRGTSFTSPSFADYLADRWKNNNYNVAPTTYSFTRETFTPGTAPVAGYEGTFFGRSTITTVGSNTQYDTFFQRIEDVRVFAGQTATLSFYAKSDSSRIQQVIVEQNFGSGGSGTVTVNPYGTNNFTTTTEWKRFSITLSFPSIAGKTIGSGSYVQFGFRQVSASGSVLDMWGMQAEYGSKATPFQTASGGSIQNELAMCQRYYIRYSAQSAYTILSAAGLAGSTTVATNTFALPVQMRVTPTSIEGSNLGLWDTVNALGTVTSPSFYNAGVNTIGVSSSSSGLTQYRPYFMTANNNSAAYIGFGAEL